MKRKQRRTKAAKKNRPHEKHVSLAEAFEMAIQLHQKDRLDEAENIYRQILALEPDHPDAHHFLGVLSHQKGRSDEAVAMIQRSLTLNPDHPDAHNNLGNVLKEMGRLEEAAQAYQSCLTLAPDNVNALSNLGAVLREMGEYEEALDSIQRAIEIAPNHAQAYHNLGNVLKKLERFDEAIAAYRKSITLLHPKDSAAFIASVYKSLSRTLFIEQKHDEAVAVLKQWLSFDPDSPTATHMLAACSGNNIPDRASDAYVEETFDTFAGSFDEVLKRLDYRAPELVYTAISAQITDDNKKLNILDAGCGTGLCGPLLKKHAANLVGVDLSKGMIDKAGGHDVYDTLVVAELTKYLLENPGTFDLIASADTLCYFGDLGEVIQAAASTLTDRGLFVFTLEILLDAQSDESYRLNPHGRYSHSQDYVYGVFQPTDMQIISLTKDKLRNEGGEPVKGMVITAIKKQE